MSSLRPVISWRRACLARLTFPGCFPGRDGYNASYSALAALVLTDETEWHHVMGLKVVRTSTLVSAGQLIDAGNTEEYIADLGIPGR
jgi:hypothetical protein